MDGLLPVIKPKGWTSFDVIRKLQRITHKEKIGHAGNLDSAATGLLLIGFGSATKQLSKWLESDKEYVFQLQFGVSTETLDTQGLHWHYAGVDPSTVNKTSLEKLIQQSFIGEILQTPPRYCALKLQGRRYADLARDQIEAEPPARNVKIFSFEILSFVWDQMHPSAIMKVHCSHGTYIRALCRDIAVSLGTIGMAKEICRNKIGPITLDEAVLLSDLVNLQTIPQYFYRSKQA